MEFELSGKVALVTGGARGIGLATSRELARRGARVIVVDLDQAAADDAARTVGGDAIGIGADVTDLGAMRAAVATAVERFGGLDVVVANAGIASRAATVASMSGEAFERVLDVNLNGVYRTVVAALPEILRRRGHVVVISSIYAFMNGVAAAPYAMAKAGVEQFGRALRIELAPYGAGASVAYFGFIDTEMVHRAIDADPAAEGLEHMLPKPLMKRLQPEQAGAAIVRGIERRQPRIIRPRRWTVLSILRGALNPVLDSQMTKDEDIHRMVELVHGRANEEQPTTA